MNPRQQKNLKRKFAAYILLLGILGFIAFFLNTFFVSGKPLFISPVGKININRAEVEKILKNNHVSFSKIISENNSYLVDISNNGQVRLSLDKDIGQQISSLQRILIQLTIEGKPFKSIDFRFAEPIISF
ncbi:MAG: hypothetical protein A3B47_00055 [Candidatus Levybacteria bacterium RIFCSPLOWO2_01_FULL_39_24]|nr:MAG: hypothetical protein A2800_01135 [Candidatus Levybacteria bacterium RIFCSPHIGHO2_01_FULL_40_16]OGH28720.1 MAG: hypothetical protein A3E12_03430 [Candidatus Levybacteria bacterium RIFCSPHIGHO2_12_FULL_39_9]OGH46169.1 MAG: hypothetical protein A3B47_00055 [Candidatus Levybacteria bacterium RIFCSPLOWO2_01_FULL_39_24]